jgi:arylformamidase
MQVPWLKGAVLIDGGSYDLVRRAQRQTDAENTIGLVFGRDGSLWSEASPVTHVAAGRNLPPFLLIHAGTNRVNEFARRELAGLLQNAAVPVELVDAPDQTHVSIQRNLGAPDDPTTAKVVEFLRKVTASPLPPAPRQKTKRRGPY